MTIERDSVHFRILERLCAMPKAVRGISGAMLDRHFGAPEMVEELAAAGLIAPRGWANGPGLVWVPTADGETVYRALADGTRDRPSFQPVRTAGSTPTVRHHPTRSDRAAPPKRSRYQVKGSDPFIDHHRIERYRFYFPKTGLTPFFPNRYRMISSAWKPQTPRRLTRAILSRVWYANGAPGSATAQPSRIR